MTTWTIEDLTKIESAIAEGVRIVEYQDRKVEYRSLKDMLATRDIIKTSLGLKQKTTRILASHNKGTC